MRAASQIRTFPPVLGPSSPRHTPTAPSPPPFYTPKVSSGPGSGPGGFSPPIPPTSLSQPPGILPFTTDYINSHLPMRAPELSPYSSHTSDADVSEPEPELSDDEDSRSGLPSPHSAQQAGMGGGYTYVRTRVTTVRDNFVIEELSDFDEDDMDGRTDIIHPSNIEYAESEHPDLDRRMLADLQNLQCRSSPDLGLSSGEGDDEDGEHHHFEAVVRARRERERRHRLSVRSTGTKRTRSERGSDASADREDVHGYIGFEEMGSSARRLRQRRMVDAGAGEHSSRRRHSLVFQDPPQPRIEEVVEEVPASAEGEEEEQELGEMLVRELPFYEYRSMQVDSPRSPYD